MAKLIFQIPPSTQQRRRMEKTVETEKILGPVLTNIPSGLFVLQYMNYVVCGLVGGSFRSAEDTLAKLIPWTQWPLLFFNCLKKKFNLVIKFTRKTAKFELYYSKFTYLFMYKSIMKD